MAGPIVLASALSRLAKIRCPWCRHEKLVAKKHVAFRKCPRCHKQFPDPLSKKR
jgi:transposase-like protein